MSMIFASPILRQICSLGYAVAIVHRNDHDILQAWNETERYWVPCNPGDDDAMMLAACYLGEKMGIESEEG
jgi:hypothetical protein